MAGDEPRHDAIIQMVWRRRSAVALAMAVCLAMGTVYLLVATPTYTSSARIYYQQTTPTLVEKGGAARSQNFLNTEMGVIHSSTVLYLAWGALEEQNLATLAESSDPVKRLKG